MSADDRGLGGPVLPGQGSDQADSVLRAAPVSDPQENSFLCGPNSQRHPTAKDDEPVGSSARAGPRRLCSPTIYLKGLSPEILRCSQSACA
jgi:hypothetical protein